MKKKDINGRIDKFLEWLFYNFTFWENILCKDMKAVMYPM